MLTCTPDDYIQWHPVEAQIAISTHENGQCVVKLGSMHYSLHGVADKISPLFIHCSPGSDRSFMFPHFDYCSCVWGRANLEKLFKLQKWAARMIYDLPTHTPNSTFTIWLIWLTIMDWVKYRMAIMVYKSLNGLAPPYMKTLFKFV